MRVRRANATSAARLENSARRVALNASSSRARLFVSLTSPVRSARLLCPPSCRLPRCRPSAVTIRTARRVRSSWASRTWVCASTATTSSSGGRNSESTSRSKTWPNGQRHERQASGDESECGRSGSQRASTHCIAHAQSNTYARFSSARMRGAVRSFRSALTPLSLASVAVARSSSACCSEKKIRSAYHLWCTDCAKGANVCPKCLQNRDIVQASVALHSSSRGSAHKAARRTNQQHCVCAQRRRYKRNDVICVHELLPSFCVCVCAVRRPR